MKVYIQSSGRWFDPNSCISVQGSSVGRAPDQTTFKLLVEHILRTHGLMVMTLRFHRGNGGFNSPCVHQFI